MVYIKQDTEEVKIPRHVQKEYDAYTIILKSRLNNEFILSACNPNISTNNFFYTFKVDTVEGLNVGEYTYEVYGVEEETNILVETGLMVYGDYTPQNVKSAQYARNTVQYTGYKKKKPEHESWVKDIYVYYAFGQDLDDMIANRKEKKFNNETYSIYTAQSRTYGDKFYVLYSKKYVGRFPLKFSCGGAPMVMNSSEAIIDGKECVIKESAAQYPADIELTINSFNE